MGEYIDKFLALSSRNFSTDVRDKYASSGIAMDDGSYPIPDVDALNRAKESLGRAGPARGKVIAHIKKRAKALGASLPPNWPND